MSGGGEEVFVFDAFRQVLQHGTIAGFTALGHQPSREEIETNAGLRIVMGLEVI